MLIFCGTSLFVETKSCVVVLATVKNSCQETETETKMVRSGL